MGIMRGSMRSYTWGLCEGVYVGIIRSHTPSHTPRTHTPPHTPSHNPRRGEHDHILPQGRTRCRPAVKTIAKSHFLLNIGHCCDFRGPTWNLVQSLTPPHCNPLFPVPITETFFILIIFNLRIYFMSRSVCCLQESGY